MMQLPSVKRHEVAQPENLLVGILHDAFCLWAAPGGYADFGYQPGFVGRLLWFERGGDEEYACNTIFF